MKTENTNYVAKTILHQLGGRKFSVMTGGKAYSLPNSLIVKFKGSRRCNTLVVKLLDNDTYKVQFFRVSKTSNKEVSLFDGVYWDQLQEIFTSETGLDTTL